MKSSVRFASKIIVPKGGCLIKIRICSNLLEKMGTLDYINSLNESSPHGNSYTSRSIHKKKVAGLDIRHLDHCVTYSPSHCPNFSHLDVLVSRAYGVSPRISKLHLPCRLQ